MRKFRTGRDVEGAIDDFIDKADRMAKHLADNPQPKPPTPEEIKAQTEREKGQMEMQKMQQAAELQHYEQAAFYRDQIQALASLLYAAGPNDVAPREYHGDAHASVPPSPLVPLKSQGAGFGFAFEV